MPADNTAKSGTIYIYVYVYMCICVYVYMSICLYVYMYICIYVYMYICIYVYMYICLYVYMYICLYVYMSICLYAYMHICIYVYMYICICVYEHIGNLSETGFSKPRDLQLNHMHCCLQSRFCIPWQVIHRRVMWLKGNTSCWFCAYSGQMSSASCRSCFPILK